jgi:tRNA 2-selenouridine synthase
LSKKEQKSKGIFNKFDSMAIEKILIEDFLSLANHYPVVDARSPAEYQHAHIPGAINLPLFTDDERKAVGSIYKQQSREAAIKAGLDFFGPKMRQMVEEAENFSANNHCLLIHCWRGGMRSAAVAWLLDLYGFKVYTLTGGYKKFRQYVLNSFSTPFHLKILGGYTGSGKTGLLSEIANAGEKVIDLEKLASHRGSAFGDLGQEIQPSQEMFENMLAMELMKNKNHFPDPDRKDFENKLYPTIWLEDESQRIGQVIIPNELWKQMRLADVVFIDVSFEKRLQSIIKNYGIFNKQQLADAICRIQKKLGTLETKNALQFLEEENIEACFRILLKYYDKLYNKSLKNRNQYPATIYKIGEDQINVPAISKFFQSEAEFKNE